MGRSCMILALMDMMLNPDLPALLAVEHIRQVRGPGAVKTVKVSVQKVVDILCLCALAIILKELITSHSNTISSWSFIRIGQNSDNSSKKAALL